MYYLRTQHPHLLPLLFKINGNRIKRDTSPHTQVNCDVCSLDAVFTQIIAETRGQAWKELLKNATPGKVTVHCEDVTSAAFSRFRLGLIGASVSKTGCSSGKVLR